MKCKNCGEELTYFDDGMYKGYECSVCSAVYSIWGETIIEGEEDEEWRNKED